MDFHKIGHKWTNPFQTSQWDGVLWRYSHKDVLLRGSIKGKWGNVCCDAEVQILLFMYLCWKFWHFGIIVVWDADLNAYVPFIYLAWSWKALPLDYGVRERGWSSIYHPGILQYRNTKSREIEKHVHVLLGAHFYSFLCLHIYMLMYSIWVHRSNTLKLHICFHMHQIYLCTQNGSLPLFYSLQQPLDVTDL